MTSSVRGATATYSPGSTIILSDFSLDRRDLTPTQLAVLWHEQIHFLHSIGTSFGLFVRRSLYGRALTVVMLLKTLAQKQGKLFFTLRDWLEDAREFETSAYPILRPAMRIADSFDTPVRFFLGLPRQRELGSAAPSFHGTRFRDVAPAANEATPEIPFGDKSFPVGGMHLMESIAYYWEMYVQRCMFRGHPNDPDWLKPIVDSAGEWSNDFLAAHVAPLHYAMSRLGPMGFYAFPAIVDIALNPLLPHPGKAMERMPPQVTVATPGEPTFKVEIQGWNAGVVVRASDGKFLSSYGFTRQWEDVHPGWRFIRIIDAIEQTDGLAKVPFMDGWWEEDYPLVINPVCETLGWPAPHVALDAYVAAAFSDVDKPSPIEQMEIRAAAAKKERPSLFTDPILEEVSRHLEDFFPGTVMLAADGEAVLKDDSPDLFQEVLSRHFITHLADEFVPMIIPFDERMLDPDARLTCPVASSHFSIVCDQPEGVKSRCRRGSFPDGTCWFQDAFETNFGLRPKEVRRVG